MKIYNIHPFLDDVRNISEEEWKQFVRMHKIQKEWEKKNEYMDTWIMKMLDKSVDDTKEDRFMKLFH